MQRDEVEPYLRWMACCTNVAVVYPGIWFGGWQRCAQHDIFVTMPTKLLKTMPINMRSE